MFANTPPPPYYAVIFTSHRLDDQPEVYAETAERMVTLAQEQKGFLGVESARGTDKLGITVSYWESLEDIRAWKRHSEHLIAQEKGRTDWYSRYITRICKVERDYSF